MSEKFPALPVLSRGCVTHACLRRVELLSTERSPKMHPIFLLKLYKSRLRLWLNDFKLKQLKPVTGIARRSKVLSTFTELRRNACGFELPSYILRKHF
eukprot:g8774.t1